MMTLRNQFHLLTLSRPVYLFIVVSSLLLTLFSTCRICTAAYPSKVWKILIFYNNFFSSFFPLLLCCFTQNKIHNIPLHRALRRKSRDCWKLLGIITIKTTITATSCKTQSIRLSILAFVWTILSVHCMPTVRTRHILPCVSIYSSIALTIPARRMPYASRFSSRHTS